MEDKSANENWQKLLEVSFVPLCRFQADDSFIGYAGSGAVISHENRKFVLTALHVFISKRIMMQVTWSEKKQQTCTLALKADFFVDTPLTRPRILDFTICEVTKNFKPPMLQNLDQNGSGKIETERPRTIHEEDRLSAPTKDTEYGFAGITMSEQEIHPSITIGSGIVRIVPGLTYIGDEDGFHIFKLPVDHPGHEFFEGCSGAPIVDIDGNIVAFVCKGHIKTSTISGFPALIAKSLLTKYAKPVQQQNE